MFSSEQGADASRPGTDSHRPRVALPWVCRGGGSRTEPVMVVRMWCPSTLPATSPRPSPTESRSLLKWDLSPCASNQGVKHLQQVGRSG